MNITPENSRRYFSLRLVGQRLGSGAKLSAKCPLHPDRTPSLSLQMDKGLWKCFAGCGEGGLIDFEMKFSNCDRNTATTKVAEIIGEPKTIGSRPQPETVYSYQDAAGRLLFEKLRYPGKRFSQRQPNGKGGWEYSLDGAQKPLYRLPELVISRYVFICEGEKDADNLASALKGFETEHPMTATTNFDGAGKWRDYYAAYFAGKFVTVLPDNDEIGVKHAEAVAASLAKVAAGVKVVRLPGLPEKGDVSDYLTAHTIQEFMAEVKKMPNWMPTEVPDRLFISGVEFMAQAFEQIDWLVEGVIQRGANGFFCAVPKGGKSWASVDLALSLALGCEWLGFRVPRPVKVALVSREDNPQLTNWRMKHLLSRKNWAATIGLANENLLVNTRAQSPELLLDNEEQMTELLRSLRKHRPEFVIFDVFNVLHSADENSNEEMRKVLRQLSRIQSEIGGGIAVIHHFNKADIGSMTQRLRGSSAIAGWAEWLIGISMHDEAARIRRMEFELKAACPPDPIFYRIESDDGAEWAKLERCEPSEMTGTQRRNGRSVAELMQ